MKRIAILIAAALFVSLSSFASRPNDAINYIVTETDTMFVDDLHAGMLNLVASLDNARHKFTYEEVKAYSFKGRYYEKMELPTGKTAFMELVSTKWNMRLFRYVHYQDKRWDLSGKLSGGEVVSYLVFQDGEFVVDVTDYNKDNLLELFGMKI